MVKTKTTPRKNPGESPAKFSVRLAAQRAAAKQAKEEAKRVAAAQQEIADKAQASTSRSTAQPSTSTSTSTSTGRKKTLNIWQNCQSTSAYREMHMTLKIVYKRITPDVSKQVCIPVDLVCIKERVLQVHVYQHV